MNRTINQLTQLYLNISKTAHGVKPYGRDIPNTC